MINSSIYIGNDSLIMLEGLKDRAGNAITDAVVTLESFQDKHGNDVAGITVPGTLAHTSDGDYELLIPKDAEVSAGAIYHATVKAIASGLQGEWTETVIARRRAA